MRVRVVGGIWLAVAAATAVFACAADPGDDPKGDAGVAVVPSGSASGGSGSGGRTVAEDSSAIGNPPRGGDDASQPTGAAMQDATMAESSTPDAATPIADAGGPPGTSCTTCPLTVEYFPRDSSPAGQTIAFDLSISNHGAMPQALSELTVRYWFTAEGATTLTMNEYYAPTAIHGNVTGTFAALAPAMTGADEFLQIAFGGSAGAIAAMGSTNDIQIAFHESNYKTTFNEANDYSYSAIDTMASCAGANNAVTCQSTKITLYRNGSLVWGVEPGGATPAGDR